MDALMMLFKRQGWNRLTSGFYGTVYAHDGSDWVVKQARNDGTRHYLEWCWYRTKQGRKMRGMPELDFLIGDDAGYVVGMRRYRGCHEQIERGEMGWSRGTSRDLRDLHTRPGCPQYVSKLVKAFEGETGLRADDLHYHNVLWDERSKSIIVTDPNSGCWSSRTAFNSDCPLFE